QLQGETAALVGELQAGETEHHELCYAGHSACAGSSACSTGRAAVDRAGLPLAAVHGRRRPEHSRHVGAH
ncbi:MAG: hypothetical protein ACPIOQ_72570, partial [Promethearchaeia archaeon]